MVGEKIIMLFKKSKKLSDFNVEKTRMGSHDREVSIDQIVHDIYQYIDNRDLPTKRVMVDNIYRGVAVQLGYFDIGLDTNIDESKLTLLTDGYDYLLNIGSFRYVKLNSHGQVVGYVDLKMLENKGKLPPYFSLLNEAQNFKYLIENCFKSS